MENNNNNDELNILLSKCEMTHNGEQNTLVLYLTISFQGKVFSVVQDDLTFPKWIDEKDSRVIQINEVGKEREYKAYYENIQDHSLTSIEKALKEFTKNKEAKELEKAEDENGIFHAHMGM